MEHQHEWHIASPVTLDMHPPLYLFACACGAKVWAQDEADATQMYARKVLDELVAESQDLGIYDR